MKYYFLFGYHGIDAWPQAKIDLDFDYESTGVIRIAAEDEQAARDWGIHIAHWYLERLHPSDSDYSWSESNYAVGIETENQELDADHELVEIRAGEYPDFDKLRVYLRD